MKKIFLTLSIILLSTVFALSSMHQGGHQNHGNMPFQKAMDKMHKNMNMTSSGDIDVDFLIGQRCKYLGKDKKFIHGEYLFTIDWAHPEPNILDTEHSEIPDQHKCAHILALDNGNYAAQPNNRILWNIGSFTTSTHWPDYKVTTTEWNVENKGWQLEDTDDMFYQIDAKENKKI